MRDDLSKLPLPSSAKKYARMTASDLGDDWSKKVDMYVNMAADVTNQADRKQGFKNKDGAGKVPHAFKESAEAIVGQLLGEQLIAWHSSPDVFRKFNTDLEGAHFGTWEQANNLHKPGKRPPKPYILNIQNPLRIRDMGVWHLDGIATELLMRDVITQAEYDAIREEYLWTDQRGFAKLKEILVAKGYDGFVYENEQEGERDSYVAFYSDQIRPYRSASRADMRLESESDRVYDAVFARWERDANEVTVADGEAGRGIYGFFENDKQLHDHYGAASNREGSRLVKFRLKPGCYVVDLRKPKTIQTIAKYAKSIGSGIKVSLETMERAYWSLTWYYDNVIPEAAGYIVPHFTPNTHSAQVVIKDPDQIEFIE